MTKAIPPKSKPHRFRNAPGEVRIIGGLWRGSKLPISSGSGLRPTPDRVRVTLFNWLNPRLPGSTCVDLFAGTGVLGLEAASRGAETVYLLDHDAITVQALQTRLSTLRGHEGIKVLQRDALAWIQSAARSGSKFDVVFLDPPYQSEWLSKVVPHVCACMRPEGAIYVELDQILPETLFGADWVIHRSLIAGQVHCYLLLHRSNFSLSPANSSA